MLSQIETKLCDNQSVGGYPAIHCTLNLSTVAQFIVHSKRHRKCLGWREEMQGNNFQRLCRKHNANVSAHTSSDLICKAQVGRKIGKYTEAMIYQK